MRNRDAGTATGTGTGTATGTGTGTGRGTGTGTGTGVRRARAHAQLLGDRAGSTAGEVVAATVGIQSQDPTAAALSIRARSRGLVMADVVEALGETREVVSTWSLRGTRHWHAREDVRWLLALLGPVFNRPGRRAEQLGISGPAGDVAVGALRDALAREGLLNRAQVKDRLAAHGVDPTGQAPIHVIRRAALEGVLCMVPTADGKERYALLDDWLPPAEPVPPERAAAELVRRYLAAFGPATPADFARWSGLGATAARTAWAAVGGELAEIGGWVLREHAERAARDAGQPVPLRLLGGFDTLVLGHADRSLLVPADRAGDVNAGGGLIRPTVLSDGEVVGTWSSRAGVVPFRELTAEELSGVERELDDVVRFLGDGPALRA
jgi:hypothetical protein